MCILINHSLKYIFVVPPKNGCSTIKRWFIEYNEIKDTNIHHVTTIQQFKVDHSNLAQYPRFKVFFVIRNTVDRFISYVQNVLYVRTNGFMEDPSIPDNQKVIWGKFLRQFRELTGEELCASTKLTTVLDFLKVFNVDTFKVDSDDHSLSQYVLFHHACTLLRNKNINPLTNNTDILNLNEMNGVIVSFLEKVHKKKMDISFENITMKEYDESELPWKDLTVANTYSQKKFLMKNSEFVSIVNTIYKKDCDMFNYYAEVNLSSMNHVLPADFDFDVYCSLNNLHRARFDDSKLIIHYTRNPNKKYKYENTPPTFCAEHYKILNKDIADLNDLMAKNHYENYGYKEGRLHNLDFLNRLPKQFDCFMYTHFNKDLANLTDELDLKKHYVMFGQKEKRRGFDEYFDKTYFMEQYMRVFPQCDRGHLEKNAYKYSTENIEIVKSSFVQACADAISVDPSKQYIVLVNHMSGMTGACFYVYTLHNYLTNLYKGTNVEILILDAKIDPIILQKTKIEPRMFREYHGDANILYMILKKLQPKLIYLNSSNYGYHYVLANFDKKVLLTHSHEMMDHYELKDVTQVDYVVSDQIGKQFETAKQYLPKTQPPFLSMNYFLKIGELSKEHMDPIVNLQGSLPSGKPVIGMSGILSERKNYKLFIQCAKDFPDYSFVWVGGDDVDRELEGIENLYHVADTQNPYKYFQRMDYFLLVSIHDPCPYVVIESLYLNKKTIMFRDNIYTHHTDPSIQSLAYEYPGAVNIQTASEVLRTLPTLFPSTVEEECGRKYILGRYSKPSDELLRDIHSRLSF